MKRKEVLDDEEDDLEIHSANGHRNPYGHCH